jgi:hypothetical protein
MVFNNGYSSVSVLKSSWNGGYLPTEIFLSLRLMLRPTVSRPVCLAIKHPSGAYAQTFISQTVEGVLMWDAFSYGRTGLSFTIAAGPRQGSNFLVRVPWESRPYFRVPDLRHNFRRLLRLTGLWWRCSTSPPHGIPRNILGSIALLITPLARTE